MKQYSYEVANFLIHILIKQFLNSTQVTIKSKCQVSNNFIVIGHCYRVVHSTYFKSPINCMTGNKMASVTTVHDIQYSVSNGSYF